MKKVLLVTYYWPPSGGAGVQRVLKTAKYLRDFGWEPVVFTAADASYPVLDQSLVADIPDDLTVIKHPIWEPYEWYKRFTGKRKEERIYSGFLNEAKKMSLAERLAIAIRGNFFIPDARKFWIRPSIRYLTNYLRLHPVDAILSSGPPHSVHMIALDLTHRFKIPWIADFRDPWTNIDFYSQLKLSRWADKRHRKLEKSVLHGADGVATVSWAWAEEFRQLGAQNIRVITNGFDQEDFQSNPLVVEDTFTFNHIGYLNADRNPSTLWEAFGELCRETPELRKSLRFRFIGKADHITFAQLEAQGLTDLVERLPYIPHSEVLAYTRSAQVLILAVNNVPNVMGHIPGKTYEYIAARRPILAIVPETADAAKIIHETGSGIACNFTDKIKMKAVIMDYFRRYKAGELKVENRPIDRYSRKKCAELMAQFLDSISAT